MRISRSSKTRAFHIEFAGLRHARAVIRDSSLDLAAGRTEPLPIVIVLGAVRRKRGRPHCATMVRVPPARKYTDKQGQYLAFIYYYTKIHGIAPAEAEIQQYFRVTPPSVHQMILALEKHGFITRTPGVARSIQLMLARPELPDLE